MPSKSGNGKDKPKPPGFVAPKKLKKKKK